MPQSRRLAIIGLAALATGTLAPWPARSQPTYPNQSIRFIVPAGAGGLPDTIARILGRRLQERVGQSVVVENKPGGNGSVGADASPSGKWTLVLRNNGGAAGYLGSGAFSTDEIFPSVCVTGFNSSPTNVWTITGGQGSGATITMGIEYRVILLSTGGN